MHKATAVLTLTPVWQTLLYVKFNAFYDVDIKNGMFYFSLFFYLNIVFNVSLKQVWYK